MAKVRFIAYSNKNSCRKIVDISEFPVEDGKIYGESIESHFKEFKQFLKFTNASEFEIEYINENPENFCSVD